MLWANRCAESATRDEPRVAAIDSPARKAIADLDLWVLSVLQARGPMTLSDLVARVADRMDRDAVRHGAACVDIGMFGARLFMLKRQRASNAAMENGGRSTTVIICGGQWQDAAPAGLNAS